ncbi:MAG: hypothetical protein B5M53_02865 [Candidatus Cloacimonas sp. 4484_209]|nr:MAG: hypothetical protein B5M53_02865 [Candidatus Cloacimonas sp. 4484_209]
MYKKGLVRFLNVLIFFALLFLVYVIVYPSYKSIKRGNKVEDVKTNMYTLRVAVENFAAFNGGKLPLSFSECKNYVDNGMLPVNPYTLEPMTDDEIIDHRYADPVAYEDDKPDGVNSKLRGDPGSIFYCTYRSPGDSTLVTHYAFIGLNEEGKPIIYIDPGKRKHIFILHD